jgi:hypothetical protein
VVFSSTVGCCEVQSSRALESGRRGAIFCVRSLVTRCGVVLIFRYRSKGIRWICYFNFVLSCFDTSPPGTLFSSIRLWVRHTSRAPKVRHRDLFAAEDGASVTKDLLEKLILALTS